MDSRISGHTGLLALIGSPVGHSGSPAMYNYSFERLGLDYVYVAFDIKVEEVADAIAAMRTFKMRGCNVTMPCKTEVVKYMDELSPADVCKRQGCFHDFERLLFRFFQNVLHRRCQPGEETPRGCHEGVCGKRSRGGKTVGILRRHGSGGSRSRLRKRLYGCA